MSETQAAMGAVSRAARAVETLGKRRFNAEDQEVIDAIEQLIGEYGRVRSDLSEMSDRMRANERSADETIWSLRNRLAGYQEAAEQDTPQAHSPQDDTLKGIDT